jgi:two-component system, OmpR family, sensor histidine kinase CpxA
MKVRFSLYLQTLAMLVLYLTTLVAIVFFCFNAQFGIGWEAALQSPLGERFETIASTISSQLHASKPANWPEILKTFEEIYHIKFYVFDIRGAELAGDPVSLPSAVASRISPLPPPPPDGFNHGPGAILSFGPGPFPGPPGPPPNGFGQGPAPGLTPLPGDFGPGPGAQAIGPVAVGVNVPPGLGPHGPIIMHGPHQGPYINSPDSFFIHSHGRFMVHTTDPDRFWICARIHVYSPPLGFSTPGLLIAACDNLWQTSLLFDFKFVTTLFAVVLGLSLAFWWPFIFRISRALSRLTQATESIAQGKFDTRIKVGGGDEIGRLSEAVDTMAERLEGYVQEQRRLLADISHELFSPLARLQLALELLESSSTSEQQGHIVDIREEVEEMNKLVSELIAYSKAGMQAKTPELTAINLQSLIEGLVPRLVNNKNVLLDLPPDMTVLADRHLLDRAISNVLRNSVRYAGQSGQIKVTAIRDGSQVVLTIADNGPGVSEEALKHLGQPFYRPEASRNRASGGFGLGLAIVKSCIEACQGSFALRNCSSGGLAVELRLKAA